MLHQERKAVISTALKENILNIYLQMPKTRDLKKWFQTSLPRFFAKDNVQKLKNERDYRSLIREPRHCYKKKLFCAACTCFRVLVGFRKIYREFAYCSCSRSWKGRLLSFVC
jgi:hypothetical protein